MHFILSWNYFHLIIRLVYCLEIAQTRSASTTIILVIYIISLWPHFGGLRYWLFWAPPSDNENKVEAGNDRASMVYLRYLLYYLMNWTDIFHVTATPFQNSKFHIQQLMAHFKMVFIGWIYITTFTYIVCRGCSAVAVQYSSVISRRCDRIKYRTIVSWSGSGIFVIVSIFVSLVISVIISVVVVWVPYVLSQ